MRKLEHLLNLLREIKVLNPDLRMGQLITMASGVNEPYYISDDGLIAALERYRAKNPTISKG